MIPITIEQYIIEDLEFLEWLYEDEEMENYQDYGEGYSNTLDDYKINYGEQDTVY